MGRSGKGEDFESYKTFCKSCHTEYQIEKSDMTKCNRCGQSKYLMTNLERKEELLGKVDEYKNEKAKHTVRKDKWIRQGTIACTTLLP